MFFLDSVGIILQKNSLSPHKIVILDKIQGKIECITLISSLSIGALITYTVKRQGIKYSIKNCSLLYIPLSLAQTDILFFHHVLELIYRFIPIGVNLKNIFNLLTFLYSIDHSLMTLQFKKLFLLKLLNSIGNIPDIDQTYREQLMPLTMIDVKQLTAMTIDSKIERILDRWLWCCVCQHPYANEFKTIHFLVKNRTL